MMQLKRVTQAGFWAMVLILTTLLAGGPAGAAKKSAPEKGKKAAEPTAQVGELAPAFILRDTDNKMHSLADYKGKVIVLIWTNPKCPFIQRHHREKTIEHLTQHYDSGRVAFLQVNSGSKEKGPEAIPTLLDTQGKVGLLYGAKTSPHVFVIGRDGKLAYAGALDDDPQGTKKPAERENYANEAIKAALARTAPGNQTTKPYGCAIKYPEKGARRAD